ncbi:MAG: uroporphyrinogen-III C-methyltransferase [Gammaproteobacteria bacterium]
MSNELEQTENAKPVKIKRSLGGFWFGMFVLLMLVVSAGAGYYLLQQIREEQKGLVSEIDKDDRQLLELAGQLTGFQSQLAAMQNQIATFEKQIAEKDQQFNNLLSNFSNLQGEKLESARNELTNAVKQVQRQLGKTRGDWLIADAEYLLSIANQRLQLLGDVGTTIEALQAADQRLRESGDAAVFKIREELAKEIARVRAVDVPDMVGIYSKLRHLEETVDKLAVLLPYAGKKSGDENGEGGQTDEESASGVNKLLDSALVEIEGLVTIRRTDQPIKSIITPEEAEFIRQQLKVKLQMVKLALIQQNDKLYSANLDEARNWLQQNFTVNAVAKDFIKELENLKQVTIRSQMPDISLSLKMLRDITKLRIETDKALETSSEEQ